MEDQVNSKISLSTFQSKFRFNVNKGCSVAVNLRDFVPRFGKNYYEIDWDVYLPKYGINLQRPFVWTEKQNSDFIISLLKDINILPVTVIMHEHRTIRIIDGKQRIHAIYSYLNNEFPITIPQGKFYFDDLPEDCKHLLMFRNLVGDIAYEYDNQPISDDDKIRMFLQINYAGTVQSEDHLNNLNNLLQHV